MRNVPSPSANAAVRAATVERGGDHVGIERLRLTPRVSSIWSAVTVSLMLSGLAALEAAAQLRAVEVAADEHDAG